MKRSVQGLSALALVAGLSACGGTDKSASEVVANKTNMMMMADPNNPFAQSEMIMDKAMMASVGVNAEDSWVRKMIEHHRGAIDMSRIVLTKNPTADAAKMAQMTIDKQSKEITDLEKLVAMAGTPDPASAELYRPAAKQMHSAMMAAMGADLSETYLRKMLEHHKGAVAMSDIALANGVTGAVRAQVEKTRADQQKEVGMVEAMLSSEPMAATPATRPSGAPTVSPIEPNATAPRAVASKPSPAPAKPKPAAPAPDPHAGMNMNNM